MIRLESPRDLQKAGAISRAFTLQDACLVRLDAIRPVPMAEAASVQLETQFDEKSSRAVVLDSGNVLRVTVEFGVRAGLTKGTDFVTYVQVEGAFELDYRRFDARAQFEDTDRQVFARINGVHNAWPYIREVVANLFGRLGYPPFTLESLVIVPAPAPTVESAPVAPNRPTAAGRN